LGKLSILIKSLPERNRNLSRYLLEFIQKVVQNSHKNQMSDSNLAIVFGPNLLRPDSNDYGLADTPAVLSKMKTFLQNMSALWD